MALPPTCRVYSEFTFIVTGLSNFERPYIPRSDLVLRLHLLLAYKNEKLCVDGVGTGDLLPDRLPQSFSF